MPCRIPDAAMPRHSEVEQRMSISVNPNAGTSDIADSLPSATTKPIQADESQKSVRAQDAIEKFEGLFMSMMIKQLRETSFGDGLFPGDASDTYGGMFDMFMGDHLARTADLGIEQLFRSSFALKQLEEHVRPDLSLGQKSKGLEEYRNEQFRTGAITLPSAP
jgi:Rod binding domain-containing protein